MGRGNIFAYAVLLLWPVIAIKVYQRKSIQEATLWVLFGGFMVLPAGTTIDLPLVPPLGKHSMPVLAAIIGCWFVKSKAIHYFRAKGLLKILAISVLALPLITARLNTDIVIIGGHVLPALTLHDALSAVINKLFLITPFFIGMQFYRRNEDQRLIFKMLVVAGLYYSIPILYEIRMSPQLHTIFYGYFPHSFAQQVRDGGYRPVVFMGHGLWVAFFVASVFTAATALWKINERINQFHPRNICYFLLVILILCKSMASLMYGVFTFVMIRKISYKMQFRAATLLACLALLYPTLSIIKVFPHQQVAELASTYMGEERAQSLVYRFDNEQILLEHGRERFFFGWGGWGRNRVYDEETGKDLSVTDGRWIIVFGIYGWLGFIVEFSMMALGIFRAKYAAQLITDKKEKTLLAAHSLLVSIIMIDQLPNASLAPWLWLIIGGLLGRSEAIIAEKRTNKT